MSPKLQGTYIKPSGWSLLIPFIQHSVGGSIHFSTLLEARWKSDRVCYSNPTILYKEMVFLPLPLFSTLFVPSRLLIGYGLQNQFLQKPHCKSSIKGFHFTIGDVVLSLLWPWLILKYKKPYFNISLQMKDE